MQLDFFEAVLCRISLTSWKQPKKSNMYTYLQLQIKVCIQYSTAQYSFTEADFFFFRAQGSVYLGFSEINTTKHIGYKLHVHPLKILIQWCWQCILICYAQGLLTSGLWS